MVRASWVVVPVVLFLVGCADRPFDEGMAASLVGAQPVKLDGEQVMLSDRQVDCGVRNDLWEAPADSGNRSIARLLPKARDLKFYDDVVVRDPETTGTFVQVRGDVPVELVGPSEIHDSAPNEKLVTAKLGAAIMHTCFTSPLPIMGVRKGQFSAEALPQLRFHQDGNGWKFDRIVH